MVHQQGCVAQRCWCEPPSTSFVGHFPRFAGEDPAVSKIVGCEPCSTFFVGHFPRCAGEDPAVSTIAGCEPPSTSFVGHFPRSVGEDPAVDESGGCQQRLVSGMQQRLVSGKPVRHQRDSFWEGRLSKVARISRISPRLRGEYPSAARGWGVGAPARVRCAGPVKGLCLALFACTQGYEELSKYSRDP